MHSRVASGKTFEEFGVVSAKKGHIHLYRLSYLWKERRKLKKYNVFYRIAQRSSASGKCAVMWPADGDRNSIRAPREAQMSPPPAASWRTRPRSSAPLLVARQLLQYYSQSTLRFSAAPAAHISDATEITYGTKSKSTEMPHLCTLRMRWTSGGHCC